MKILHTSDWHLGKRLHQIDLTEDHRLFFDWLIQITQKEPVDAIIVSGDIFDLANPSSEARKLYYETLVKLAGMNCTVIITGGNHDSPSVLNAPKEVLKALNIHVVGGLSKNMEDMIIPLSKNNKEIAIAAIPFLRDSDIRQAVQGESHQDRIEAIKAGITRTFNNAAETCERLYPNIPAIAMGHLFTHGASTSESERDIQIGNLAGYEVSEFNDYFSYYALGHIHRPQNPGNSNKLIYSGSPIPLSFSEKSDVKRIVVYDFSEAKPQYKSIEIPENRKLIKITGTYTEVHEKLMNIQPEKTQMPALIEVEMIEEKEDPQKVTALEELISKFNHPNAIVVKHRIHFRDNISGANELYDTSKHIEELNPGEVFEKKMERSALDENQKTKLREAFHEILEYIYQSE